MDTTNDKAEHQDPGHIPHLIKKSVRVKRFLKMSSRLTIANLPGKLQWPFKKQSARPRQLLKMYRSLEWLNAGSLDSCRCLDDSVVEKGHWNCIHSIFTLNDVQKFMMVQKNLEKPNWYIRELFLHLEELAAVYDSLPTSADLRRNREYSTTKNWSRDIYNGHKPHKRRQEHTLQ